MPIPLLFLFGWNNVCTLMLRREGGLVQVEVLSSWEGILVVCHQPEAERAADTNKWEVQQGSL